MPPAGEHGIHLHQLRKIALPFSSAWPLPLYFFLQDRPKSMAALRHIFSDVCKAFAGVAAAAAAGRAAPSAAAVVLHPAEVARELFLKLHRERAVPPADLQVNLAHERSCGQVMWLVLVSDPYRGYDEMWKSTERAALRYG